MRHYLSFLFLVLPLIAHSQYSETIRTGRPGAAIGAFTVGSKVFQVQSGVNLGQFTWDSDQNVSSTHGVAVFRYGILERLEVSAVAGYSKIGMSSLENHELDREGLSAAQIGFRVNIRDGNGSGPNIGLQSRLKMNILSEDFDQPLLATTTILAATQKLGHKLSLAVNLGISTSGQHDDSPAGLYAVNFNMPVGKSVSVFLENYGRLKNQDLETKFDTGVGYLVNKNFQLDASVGYGKNHGVEDYYLDFGFSWRTGGGGSNRVID